MWSPEEAKMGGSRSVDRAGAEVVLVREAGDVADLDQQPGSAGGADAVQVNQGGSGLLDECGQFLVGGLLSLVDPLELGDQFGGGASAGVAGDAKRSDGGEQLLGLGSGQVLLRPAWDQLQEKEMQAARSCGCARPSGPVAGRPGSAAPPAARR